MSLSSILRNAAGTTTRGFLLGIGFSFAVGICVLFGWPVINAKIDAQMKELQAQSHADISDIELSDLMEQQSAKSVYILGRVTNHSKKPAGRVEIQVNFFNAGNFVDQCVTTLNESLGSGASAYFKAVCCCNEGAATEHDDFKVLVARTDWP